MSWLVSHMRWWKRCGIASDKKKTRGMRARASVPILTSTECWARQRFQNRHLRDSSHSASEIENVAVAEARSTSKRVNVYKTKPGMTFPNVEQDTFSKNHVKNR